MECPKCSADNSDASQSCAGCGHKFIVICPNCNFENALTHKFCSECGSKVAESKVLDLTPLDEKIDKIQRYLPEGSIQKILSQKDRIEGERKQVTVMFCDLVGFTSISEKLDPEEIYSIMDQVLEILIHKVHDYGGTVNKMMGDGIMALFGAPIALEDGPQRAIRSAINIHKEITRFSERISEEKDLPSLKMRIGINTGLVVVGTIGNNLRVEFTAIGDTVNLASRMESIALPGTTCVSGNTFDLTEHYFRFEALGEKRIKGKEKPVKVFQVIAPSTRSTRFDVSAEQGLTPLVGRQQELGILLDGFQTAKAYFGRAFSVIAEAGTGKSRLLYEFRKSITGEETTILESKCLSYATNVSYFPIIDIIKSDFDIQEMDEESVIYEKIKTGLSKVHVDDATTCSFLLDLFSIKHSIAEEISLSRDEKKSRFIEVFKQIIKKNSEIQTTVLVIEDLHWIDTSSADVLQELIDAIKTSRVLLIFTYRPEATINWSNRPYHSQITLNQLSSREILSMAHYLLVDELIHKSLQELILEKTEGNPFYLEELIKSFKDLDIIVKKDNHYQLTRHAVEMIVPSTIQDVIMTRVDSLPGEARNILQTGSVIEREFKYILLEKSTGLSKDVLLPNILILKEAELLIERGEFPEATFFFKHSLIREVVYDSLLGKRKKTLHSQIGCAIETTYQDSIQEHFAILAEHFIKAEKYEKGAQYAKKSARRAEKNASFIDAIDHTRKRIAALEKLPHSQKIQQEIVNARIDLGLIYHNMSYLVEAKEAINPVYDVAVASDNRTKLPLIYTILGAYHGMVDEDTSKALQFLGKAVDISKETGDIPSEIYANLLSGLTLTWNCEFEKAVAYIDKALDIVETFKITWSVVVIKSSLSFYVYNYQGKINQGYEASREALQIAEANDDIFSEAYACTCHGISYYYKGIFKKAEKFLLLGADICEKIKLFTFGAVARQYLGFTYYSLGEYQKSQDSLIRAIHLRELNRIFPSTLQYNKVALERSKLANEEDVGKPDLLLEYDRQCKIKLYSGSIARFIGDIFLKSDDQLAADAESWIKRAITAHLQNGMRWHLAQDYCLYGDYFTRCRNKLKASEFYSQAIDIFQECGADGWSEKTRHTLSAL